MVNKTKKVKEKNKHPLKQIYFYLTEGCNLACRHCWLSPKIQNKHSTYPTLSIELFKSVLEQAKPLGLNGVKLTGGEPLMHPEISEILTIIKEQDLHIILETNGVLCISSLAEEIVGACKNPSVSVSLDGADAKTHEWVRGVDGCFELALEGVRNLVIAGVKPQIIMTVMKHNKDQLEAIVRLAESLGAGSVKFNLVQPTGRGEKMNENGETVPLEELIKLGQCVFDELSPSTELKLYYDIPIAFRPMSKMFGKKGDGCATCAVLNIIGVLADGDYALCGIGSQVPELLFGNAANDRLDVVWKTNEIILELREGIPDRFEGICGRCHMKRICSASCIAQNYYRSRSLWNAYWFCDEAYRKGLFPKTRISPKPVK
jgi:SynChlorMet cassette radical SAM/SPASM protein ScmF